MPVIPPKTPQHGKIVLGDAGVLAQRDGRNPFVLKKLGARAGGPIFFSLWSRGTRNPRGTLIESPQRARRITEFLSETSVSPSGLCGEPQSFFLPDDFWIYSVFHEGGIVRREAGAHASRVSAAASRRSPSLMPAPGLPRRTSWREPQHGFPRGRGKQHAGRMRSRPPLRCGHLDDDSEAVAVVAKAGC